MDNDVTFQPVNNFEVSAHNDERMTTNLESSRSEWPTLSSEQKEYHGYFQQPNTCRILQRKLEIKVEKAKRNYNQYQDICFKKSQSSSLIPIERLQIPGFIENRPLVDYKSESDDQEEISFFPAKLKNGKKHELSDTFSIQEMTIESENSDGSDISPNLELLPPRLKPNLFDKVLNCFYCAHSEI